MISPSSIFAIDPGPQKSAYCLFDAKESVPHNWGILPNDELLDEMEAGESYTLADLTVIEMISSYGMAVGAEVFETCVWIGRFMQVHGKLNVERIFRKDVKLALCGSSRAKDANIRQALIDLYGGKDKAIGSKRKTGPLYGMKADAWAALAVAVAWCKGEERHG